MTDLTKECVADAKNLVMQIAQENIIRAKMNARMLTEAL